MGSVKLIKLSSLTGAIVYIFQWCSRRLVRTLIRVTFFLGRAAQQIKECTSGGKKATSFKFTYVFDRMGMSSPDGFFYHIKPLRDVSKIDVEQMRVIFLTICAYLSTSKYLQLYTKKFFIQLRHIYIHNIICNSIIHGKRRKQINDYNYNESDSILYCNSSR